MRRIGRRRRIGLAASLATAVALSVAGAPVAAWAGGGGGLCAGFAEGDAVVMRDVCFDGIAQRAGDATELTVTNEGQLPHTYTAVDGSFDTGELAPGDSATVALDGGAAAIAVYCTLHGTARGEGMAGMLLTGAAASDGAVLSAATAPDRGVAGRAADVVTIVLLGAIAVLAVAILRTVRALAGTGRARSRPEPAREPV